PTLSAYDFAQTRSAFKNTNCAIPSLAYTRAGSGVVLLISSVILPRHSGSSGVTFTINPHRAYVLLPTHSTITSRGISIHSTVSHSANEFGGMITWSTPIDAVS